MAGGLQHPAGQTPHQFSDDAVDQVQDELQSFLGARPACRRRREAECRHRDDVRGEPHRDPERQSDGEGDARHTGGDCAVESTDGGSEGVVDQVARDWLHVVGQRTLNEPSRHAIGDLDGGVVVCGLVPGRLLVPSTSGDTPDHRVGDTHRTGTDHTAHETRDHAAPDAHVATVQLAVVDFDLVAFGGRRPLLGSPPSKQSAVAKEKPVDASRAGVGDLDLRHLDLGVLG